MQDGILGSYRPSRAWAVMLVCAAAIVSAACSDSGSTEPLVPTGIAVAPGSDAQSGIVALPLRTPISVLVTDQNGAPLSNVRVTWSLPLTKGSLSSVASITDSQGNASVGWTLGPISGLDSLTASFSLAPEASVTITATALAAGLSSLGSVSGNAQTVTPGASTVPFIVKAKDQFGNPVANTIVIWSSTGGSLSAAATVTDSSGLAQVTLKTDAAPATYSITASAGGTATVTFTANGA